MQQLTIWETDSNNLVCEVIIIVAQVFIWMNIKQARYGVIYGVAGVENIIRVAQLIKNKDIKDEIFQISTTETAESTERTTFKSANKMLHEHFKMDITKRYQLFSEAYAGLSKNWESDKKPCKDIDGTNLQMRMMNIHKNITTEQMKLKVIDASLEPIEAALKKTGDRKLIPAFKKLSSDRRLVNDNVRKYTEEYLTIQNKITQQNINLIEDQESENDIFRMIEQKRREFSHDYPTTEKDGKITIDEFKKSRANSNLGPIQYKRCFIMPLVYVMPNWQTLVFQRAL